MLNFAEDVKSLSYMKSHTDEVIRKIKRKNGTMLITDDGEAKFVMMGVSRHQKIINAVNLMKILSFGENDLRNGRTYSNEKVKEEIDSILAE